MYGKEEFAAKPTLPTLAANAPPPAAGGAAAFHAGVNVAQAHFAQGGQGGGQSGQGGQGQQGVESCEPQQYPGQHPSPGQTGAEQYGATQTGAEQQQGYQWDGPDKLPQKLQNKLAEKIDGYMARPPSGSFPAPGVSGMATMGAAGYAQQQQQQQQQPQYQQQPGFGYSPSSSPPPSSPPMNNAGFGAGPNYNSGMSVTPSPPPMQYGQQTTNVAVPGQSSVPAQTPYQTQLASQYKGYAEPSRGLPNQ